MEVSRKNRVTGPPVQEFYDILCMYHWPRYNAIHIPPHGHHKAPEARLPPMMGGAVLFAAGLFMFGGGSGSNKSAAISIVGAGMIGSGFILIFQNAVNYLIDAFTVHAASAQAANTFLRSLAGAGFPLFATPMFHKLRVNWASFLLGFIAVILIPSPFLFYIFGERLRGISRYNPNKPMKTKSKNECGDSSALTLV
jgi:hypothetical protein